MFQVITQISSIAYRIASRNLSIHSHWLQILSHREKVSFYFSCCFVYSSSASASATFLIAHISVLVLRHQEVNASHLREITHHWTASKKVQVQFQKLRKLCRLFLFMKSSPMFRENSIYNNTSKLFLSQVIAINDSYMILLSHMIHKRIVESQHSSLKFFTCVFRFQRSTYSVFSWRNKCIQNINAEIWSKVSSAKHLVFHIFNHSSGCLILSSLMNLTQHFHIQLLLKTHSNYQWLKIL